MAGKPRDISGNRYGRLTAVELADRDRHGRIQWKFRCDCGTVKVCNPQPIKNGKTKSCGCLAREISEAIKRLKQGA